LLAQKKIVGVIAPARLPGNERDRAVNLISHLNRHYDAGAATQLEQDLKMPWIKGDFLQMIFADLRREDRLPRGDDLVAPLGAILADRIIPSQVFQERRLARIRMDRRDPLIIAVLPNHYDMAPVGEKRDRNASEAIQSPVVVQRS